MHPLALASPVLRSLPLEAHGLEWLHPDAEVAHPLDGGRAGVLERSVVRTADGLGGDGSSYRRLMERFVEDGDHLVAATLSPLSIPPVSAIGPLTRFGWAGVRPLASLARSRFDTDEAQGLLAGLAAHSMLSLRSPGTGGFGLFMATLAHLVGWPVAGGGSQSIADALVSLAEARGAQLELGSPVTTLDELPPARATLLDVTPHQMVEMAGDRLSSRYRRRLARFRRGPGVWKVDWALDGPIPWTAEACRRTATVHLGGTLAEVVAAEDEVQRGRHPERPFVLVVQASVVDPSRAPAGQQTAWAYCHVPNGSTFDMTDRIERQLERFAPGFRDRVLARRAMSPQNLQSYNANYLGGDISGGRANLVQLAARPVLARSPWRTPVPGLYLCSASTPPGPGVHGMCGWHAATTTRRDAGDLIEGSGPA